MKTVLKTWLIMALIIFQLQLCFSVEPYTYWIEKFEKADNYEYWLNLSQTKNSYKYYHLAYGLDAQITMFEVTDSVKYLNRAIQLTQNVINNALPSYNIPNNNSDSNELDKYLGWISYIDNNTESILREAYFFRYVTKLLIIFYKIDSLISDSLYRQKFDSILAFTEENIWEKWYNRDMRDDGTMNKLINCRTHMTSHWGLMALNLYFIGNKNIHQYLKVLANINKKMVSLEKHPRVSENFSWIYTDWGVNNIIQDVSHANNVISFLVESHNHCIFWDSLVMVGLQEMLMKVTYRDSVFHMCFDSLLCGTDFCSFDYNTDIKNEKFPDDHKNRYFHLDGWIKLGRYSEEIQLFYENNLLAINELYPELRAAYYAQMAYNAKTISKTVKPCNSYDYPLIFEHKNKLRYRMMRFFRNVFN